MKDLTKSYQLIFILFVLLSSLALAACGSVPEGSTSETIVTTVEAASNTAEHMMDGTAMAMEFDQMFIDMMVPHHQGAVEMAQIAQERAEHPEIKEMAAAIITAQEGEIETMRQWRQQWYGSDETPAMSEMPSLHDMPDMGEAGHPMDMAEEVEQLRNAPDPFDRAFIEAMIPHHQSAIDAARLAEQQATRPEIKQLAQAIVADQQRETDQMNGWLEAWYGSAEAVATPTQ